MLFQVSQLRTAVYTSTPVQEKNPLICNDTCTADCDFVKTFLDDDHFKYCMTNRCICSENDYQNDLNGVDENGYTEEDLALFGIKKEV